MTHFNEALSPIILCQRSLVDVDNAVHEEAVLRVAIELLRQVYEEIDAAERVIHGHIGTIRVRTLRQELATDTSPGGELESL
jgi:hypothetical protein